MQKMSRVYRKEILVSDIMFREPVICQTQEKLESVTRKILDNGIGAMIVIDGQSEPTGIITKGMILRHILAEKDTAFSHTAEEIMEKDLITARPTDSIEEVYLVMGVNAVKRMPVMEDRRLVGIITQRDITNAWRQVYSFIEEKNETLHSELGMDHHTGVFNKKFILEEIDAQIEYSSRTGAVFSIVMADIDNFKKVNDTYGHLAGDHVLKEIAKMLSERSRDVNTVGRFGGDEFIIVAPFTDFDATFHMAERLRSIVAESIFEYEGQQIHTTISMGLSVWSREINKKEEIIKLADNCLYWAKTSGKNRVSSIGGIRQAGKGGYAV